MLLEELRRLVFWSLDWIHKGEIRGAYNQIKRIDQAASCSDLVDGHQHQAFQRLVEHVKNTVPFYFNKEWTELTDFPVVDKKIIRDNQKEFSSNHFDKKDLYTMHTSGSTGTPFVIYQNKEKKNRVHAEVIYYSNKAGYRVGYPFIFLKDVTRETKKSRFKQYVQNQPIISCQDLSDQGIIRILNKMQELIRKHSIVLAYGSTYNAIRKFIDRVGSKFTESIRPSGLVGSSDMLFDETRHIIEKTFQCRCYSRYSNEECGVMAQDDKENNHFLLNEANYIIEILDLNSTKPAPPNQIGRIVVTDLYNYSMPLIRYDTGDVGRISFIDNHGVAKKAIVDFAGRKIDMIYNSSGELLSPYSVSNLMSGFEGLEQFQLIQTNHVEYTMKIVAPKAPELKKVIHDALLNILGLDACISIILVDEIKPMSSGKRNYIINDMKKNANYSIQNEECDCEL
jgi:phenylacetate-CoA ligase